MTNEDENWETIDKNDDFLKEYELSSNYPDLVPNLNSKSGKIGEKARNIEDDPSDYETKLDLKSKNAVINSKELSGNLNFLSTSILSGYRLKFHRSQSLNCNLTDDDNSTESLSIKSVEITGDNDEILGEYSLVDERRDLHNWQPMVLGSGEARAIDMRVIEPYKRVLSHGGYLRSNGSMAILLFSSCFLPDKTRIDYDYVMDNLFMYILKTMNELATDEYVLVYFHGSAMRKCMPTYTWLRKSYQLVDRKLRKNCKQLLIVHPTFWFRTLITFIKPFISSKFYRKLIFVKGIEDLFKFVPTLEPSSIPDEIMQFDKEANR